MVFWYGGDKGIRWLLRCFSSLPESKETFGSYGIAQLKRKKTFLNPGSSVVFHSATKSVRPDHHSSIRSDSLLHTWIQWSTSATYLPLR